MLSYLANTLIFAFVGVAITEKAFKNLEGIDILYIIIDYIGVIIIRFVIHVPSHCMYRTKVANNLYGIFSI